MKNLKLFILTCFFAVLFAPSVMAQTLTTTANVIFTDSAGNSISAPPINGEKFIMVVIFTNTTEPENASINSLDGVVFGSWGGTEFLNPSGNTRITKFKLILDKNSPNQKTTQTWKYLIEAFDNGFNKILEYTGNTSLAAPLPVLFSKIEVVDHTLLWETAQEINNFKFIIQASSSSEENWIDIGEVLGSGNSNEVKKYSIELPLNIENNSFIRIKQVDFDGKFEFSDMIKFSQLEETPKIIDLGDVILVPEGTKMFNSKGQEFIIQDLSIKRSDFKGEPYFIISPSGERMEIFVR